MKTTSSILILAHSCISVLISHYTVSATFALPVASEDRVVVLTDSTFDETIKGGEWLVEFYAKWCPACRQFKSDFEDLAELAFRETPVLRLAKVDIDESPILTARFLVAKLPSLFYVNDLQGQKEVQSLNTIRVGTIADLIMSQSWSTAAPKTNSFIGPFSILGRMLGYAGLFGKIISDAAIWLQNVGVPTWLIIILGALLLIYIILFLPIPGLSSSQPSTEHHRKRHHHHDKLDEDYQEESGEEDDLLDEDDVSGDEEEADDDKHEEKKHK